MEKALEFYYKNKNIVSKLPSLPWGIRNDYEISDWLLNKSNFGWLELDIEIDVEKWKFEFELSKSCLVPHRESDSYGWNSCCIHGIDVGYTGAWTNYGYKHEQDVPYQWTSLSKLTPCIKDFWNNFPYDNYRRIRFMEVISKGYINPHSDMPGRLPGEENFNALEFGVPINIAIIHPDDCFMTLENYGVVPFKEGKAFIINIRNYHSVINFSDRSRIHLISHGTLNNRLDEFTKIISRSYKKQYEAQS